MKRLMIVLAFASLTGCATAPPSNIVAFSPLTATIADSGGGRVTLLSQGPIVYPRAAWDNKLDGKVVVRVSLADDGRVLMVAIVSSSASAAQYQDVSTGKYVPAGQVFNQVAYESMLASTWRVEGHQPTGQPIIVDFPMNFMRPVN